MESILTSIDTLYDRIIQLTVRCIRAYTEAYKKQSVKTEYSHKESKSEVLEVPHETKVEEESSFHTVQDVLQRLKTKVHTEVASHNTIMYAGTVSVPLFKNPTIEFDSQIGTIPYGAMVMMLEPQGRFYRVNINGTEGWVLRDDLVDRAIRVHPQFTRGEPHSVDHPNTAHVRAIIGDTFSLSRSEFPLQAGEYVLYKLWKKGIYIEWPSQRPRVPGLWHVILKGQESIRIGVIPKVGSVMEYMIDGDMGHVAYVEAVFPDQTIALSEVNYPDSGIYNERELSRETWRELKPLFITIHESPQKSAETKL